MNDLESAMRSLTGKAYEDARRLALATLPGDPRRLGETELSADPRNRAALQIAAIATRKLGRAEEALVYWRLSLKIPLGAMPIELMTRLADLTVDFQNETYLNISPEALAYANMGAELARAGEIREANRLFDKAIEIDPDCELAHFNRGISAYNSRDYRLAERCMREVLRINPHNQVAKSALHRLHA